MEVLIPDSAPPSPTCQPSLPLPPPCPPSKIGHLILSEDSLTNSPTLPSHSTPLLQIVQASPRVGTVSKDPEEDIPVEEEDVTKDEEKMSIPLEADKSKSSMSRLDTDKLETGSGRLEAGWTSSLPHSGSRHSLASRGQKEVVLPSQGRRKEGRRQRSAQLPAHGEVQKMEHSLLKLLNEFNSGQLRAFDSAYSLEQMENVRDQQEAIAKRHFELGAEQDLHPPLSDDGLRIASENMGQLMGSLEKLSLAIGQLSCLDRMVDRGGLGGHQEGPGDSREARERPPTFSREREVPLVISRRSTVSSRTETVDTEEFFDRLSNGRSFSTVT